MWRPPRFLEQRPAPKCTGHVVEDLGVEFLPAEPGALVFFDDLRHKRWRQIGPVVVCRAARDDGRGIGDQVADDLDRLRRGSDDDARIIA